MNWNILQAESQLNELDEQSNTKPILIFKHSTRCSISSAALSRFERNWNDTYSEKFSPYFLDLINNRTVSNAVATHYKVEHESPQIVLIKNGKCVFSQSHFNINLSEIVQEVEKI